MQNRTISATDIATWSWCPRSYYYQKVQGIRSIMNDKMLIGRMVHEIYEKFMAGNSSLRQCFLETVVSRMVESNETIIRNLEMDKEKILSGMKAIAQKLIEKHKNGHLYMPTHMEYTLTFNGVVARPDCIFEKNGELIVGDVKYNGNNSFGTRLQLTVGALLMEKCWGKQVSKGVIIHGQNWGEEYIEITDDLRKISTHIIRIIKKFNENPFLPNKCNHIGCKVCADVYVGS